MRYRCHQCFQVVDWREVAHIDLYSDVCWIQCFDCELLWGNCCGVDRKHNPHPHGYFACPYRLELGRDDGDRRGQRARLRLVHKPDGPPELR